MNQVGAGATGERVVAGAAQDQVAGRAADDGVEAAATVDALEAGECDATEVERVGAAAALDRVGPRPAVDRLDAGEPAEADQVVARTAEDAVVPGAAVDRIHAGRAALVDGIVVASAAREGVVAGTTAITSSPAEPTMHRSRPDRRSASSPLPTRRRSRNCRSRRCPGSIDAGVAVMLSTPTRLARPITRHSSPPRMRSVPAPPRRCRRRWLPPS